MNTCVPERFDGLVYFIATSLPLHERNSCSVEISIKYLDVYLTSKIIHILFNRSKNFELSVMYMNEYYVYTVACHNNKDN